MSDATLVVSTLTAGAGQNDAVRGALRSQRARLPELLRTLDDDDWRARSRCTEWTVPEVVRHLCDATVRVTALLRGEVPEGTDGFDPRTTPVEWLSQSAGESPEATLRRFEAASAELLAEVDRLAGDTDGRVPFLYGPVPWSVAVLHLVWDAWVHERDIVVVLGRPHDAPADESRPVAAYGLALAGVALGTVDASFVLDGVGGGPFRVESNGPRFTVVAEGGAASEPLRGDLAAVVDSLVGREGELAGVLHGPPDEVERLGAFRAFMLLPTA